VASGAARHAIAPVPPKTAKSGPLPSKSAIESHLRFAESFRVHGPVSTSESAAVSTPPPRNNSLHYNLLHGLDENALADGQQVELGKVSDILSDAPLLRYITNLHTCPGKQFLRRKSTPVFHPRAAAARSASSQSVMPHQRRNRSPGAPA